MSKLPPYISDLGHGQISYAVPLAIREVTSYAFVLKCETARVQTLLDSQLNAIAGSPVRYEALPFLFHCYLQAKHCTSTAEVIGWLPDRESAFLVPVLEHRAGHLLPRLKIWVPYLLIDQMAGMVTGREVWGYRKSLGAIQVPDDPQQPTAFAAQTTVFKTFSAQTEGLWQTLVQVRQTSAAAAQAQDWKDHGEAIGAVIERLAGEVGGEVLALLAKLLEPLLKLPTIPIVNLKQFRDVQDSTRACYQALVESPCRMDRWRHGGWLGGDFELDITTCASHQVVQDLGLAAAVGADTTTVNPLFGLYAQFDFSTLPGSVIWQKV